MEQEHIARKEIPTLQAYIAGYSLSLLITLASFAIAYLHLHNDHRVIPHPVMHVAIAMFAVLQLLVQTIFFLHLSFRKEDRSRFMAYIFTIYTVAFIVIGSLWVLNNLNSNMSPEQVAKYMHNED